MLSYLYSYFYPEEEIQVDQKALRQKYLVLLQIKDHKIRLKSTKKVNTVIPPHKRPIWKKQLILQCEVKLMNLIKHFIFVEKIK